MKIRGLIDYLADQSTRLNLVIVRSIIIYVQYFFFFTIIGNGNTGLLEPVVICMPPQNSLGAYKPTEPSHDRIYSVYKTEDAVPGCKGTHPESQDLKFETIKIRGAFNALWTKLRRFLVNQKVQVKDFVSFLKKVPAYTSNEESLFESVIPELSQMTDLIDVFEFIADYCSWFNFSFIDNIFVAYCDNDESIKEAKAEYCQQLRKYCKHRVCKCYGSLKNGFGIGRRRDCTHITVKVDVEWNLIRIEQLEEVMHCLADIFKTQRHTLYLRSVEKGCIQLTILAPELINKLFPLLVEQVPALIEARITQLHCNNYHFFSHLVRQSHIEDYKVWKLSGKSVLHVYIVHTASHYHNNDIAR